MNEYSRPYEKLKFYQNICTLRKEVFRLTKKFERKNVRLVSHMRETARSAKRNIREGYRKDSLGQFIHFIRISRASLEELIGDLEDCKDDEMISEDEFKKCLALYKSTDYLINRYILSLNRMQKEGTWKVPHAGK